LANDPVRRGEWDRAWGDADRRFERLERWQEKHDEDHDEDEDARAKEAKDRGQWTVTRTVAVITVAAALMGLVLQAISRH